MMSVLVIMVVMSIVMTIIIAFLSAISAEPFIHFAVRPFHDFIQFSTIQPYTAAFRTKIDFNTLPFGNL